MNTNFPYFSIIIPTLNEEKNLSDLLLTLQKQTNTNFEVIVSDSHSADNTKNVAESFKKKLQYLSFFQQTFKNVSMARNFGASQAKGEYIIFFDADVSVENNFLNNIHQEIIKHRLDALSVWNRPKEKSITGFLVLYMLNISMTLFQKIKPVANGPCIVMRKKLFEELKGFNERIVFGEDFDLIQRAWRKHARFAVFRKPLLFVSIRRFEKEGLLFSLYKSLKAFFYQIFFGPITQPIFEYEMGGQYYKKE